MNFEVHRRLLERTRVLPCRDIDGEIPRPISGLLDSSRDASRKEVGRENLRPLSGSYDIELSIQHQQSCKDSDVSVVNKRSYDRIHEHRDDISRRPLSVSADANLVKLGVNKQSVVYKGSYENGQRSIPAVLRNDGPPAVSDLHKTNKLFVNEHVNNSSSAFINGFDRRQMSRIDRLSLRQRGMGFTILD